MEVKLLELVGLVAFLVGSRDDPIPGSSYVLVDKATAAKVHALMLGLVLDSGPDVSSAIAANMKAGAQSALGFFKQEDPDEDVRKATAGGADSVS